ncbi:radical SAM family heme chaperone HemW [Acholeplasma sp. OttesenSCG-928-E16]|nr:radical SAM family heme chaperone HemW [Acholeplasma sp. OttesenSCG-928-E16]
MKGLYIHIPFCKTICSYCDFVKKVPYKNEISEYMDALIKEIRTYSEYFSSIDTIYIGGGTPNLLGLVELEKLLYELREINPIEFSIEINPDLYSFEFGKLLKKYGVNRISLGVQSFNETNLSLLKRTHSKENVYTVFESLTNLGFQNINIDMIFGIPGQTLSDLENDIDEVIRINPAHVSFYSLILENNTLLYHQYKYKGLSLVDEDTEAQMFNRVIDKLSKAGYTHYEISNFCHRGFESKHNLKYWELEEYIGVGLGSSGFIDGIRTKNNRVISQYIKNTVYERIEQTPADLIQDEMIFGLRKIDGVNIEKINQKYGIDILRKYEDIKKRIQDGLLEIVDGNLRLTKKGIFLGNQVFEIFV